MTNDITYTKEEILILRTGLALYWFDMDRHIQEFTTNKQWDLVKQAKEKQNLSDKLSNSLKLKELK